MPSAIFTDPEIATVGLTESEAKAKGIAIKVGKFPFAASGRAMADQRDRRLHQDHRRRRQGSGARRRASSVPEASDLIAEAALAIEMCAYAEDVALTVHTHPTLAEAMNESFRHALKEAIHILNK